MVLVKKKLSPLRQAKQVKRLISIQIINILWFLYNSSGNLYTFLLLIRNLINKDAMLIAIFQFFSPNKYSTFLTHVDNI